MIPSSKSVKLCLLLAYFRYNKRELGLYVASQLLVRHLDPTSDQAEFARPATATGGPGGRLSMTSLALSANMNSRYYEDSITNRLSSGPTCKPNSQIKDILPQFQHPRTVYMRVPGNKVLLIATLPIDIELDSSDMVTGDAGTSRLSIIKVGIICRYVGYL